MSKSPGQKAYEAATRQPKLSRPLLKPNSSGQLGWRLDWEELHDDFRAEWEAVAAAVTTPEPKSYGEVLHEAWMGSDIDPERDSWADREPYLRAQDELAAQAVIAEFKRREGIK